MTVECLDQDESRCSGAIEYRPAMSGSGESFPRCDRHFTQRRHLEEDITDRYPSLPPEDFDPMDAGEDW